MEWLCAETQTTVVSPVLLELGPRYHAISIVLVPGVSGWSCYGHVGALWLLFASAAVPA